MALTREPLFMRVNNRSWSDEDLQKISDGTDDYLVTLALNNTVLACEEALAWWIAANTDASGVAAKQFSVTYPPIPGITRGENHRITVWAPTLEAAWWYIAQFSDTLPLSVDERVVVYKPVKLLDKKRFQELVKEDLNYI